MQVVITTIFKPTAGAERLSAMLAKTGGTLWVMGDRPGPADYPLPATKFYDINQQRSLSFSLAKGLPEKHYTRKNLGYLLAIQAGAQMLVETDDDNLPLPNFWNARAVGLKARRVSQKGWFNAYRAFGQEQVWPRGFPLELIREPAPAIDSSLADTECFIQQGLANQNPDVDAVYRLVMPLPVDFVDNEPLALGAGCWCPFNSQNTTWFKPAFPLMYLPSCCSFRMTDIWRSFVAQRCLWEMNSQLAFTSASVYQERNDHNLLKDFQQEVPGYLQNNALREMLEATALEPGREPRTVCENLRRCYQTLITKGVLPAQEGDLVNAWIADLSTTL